MKVEARANLTAYESVTPNGWEPMGYNTTGTAPYYITHSLGWNDMKIMGNVGAPVLNNNSDYVNGYTDNVFMAGDISTAPWDQGRLTSAYGLAASTQAATTAAASENASAANNSSSTAGNASRKMLKVPDVNGLRFDKNVSDNASATAANNTTIANTNQISVGNKFTNMPLNNQYHSMLLGRPVDDLMYEYPLAPTISAYFRLVGIPMPCGSGLASLSMRCLGYGY